MIKVETTKDKFDSCISCHKNKDEKMLRITFSFDFGKGYNGTVFCLCDKCREILKKAL